MALPTNEEQELLQLVNRFRADPAGEAARIINGTGMTADAAAAIAGAMGFFGVDTALFTQQLAALSAAAPLAWNSNLNDAAAAHSAAMIAADMQSHQVPGEDSLGPRVTAAGYSFASLGENIYAFASSPNFAHAGFVVDWGPGTGGMQTPAGHRDNLINAGLSEIGIDMTHEDNPATSVGPLVVTQDLGRRFSYAPQLVGVAFADADGDQFYDAGEGSGGVTVTATGLAGTFTTATWASGGYELAVPAGSYSVTFSGGGLTGSYTTAATMAAANVEVDAQAAQFSVPAPVPVASLSADQVVSEAAVRLVFTVSLDIAPTSAMSVRWSLADGTATAGDGDMPVGQGGTLSFAVGQNSAAFAVLVNDEAYRQEPTEGFSVVLDQPAGVSLGRASAAVTLLDDYVPPPAVPLAMTDTTLGSSSAPEMAAYAGPLNYLDQQFIYLGSDGIVLSANAPNVFLHSGSGDDALAVVAGQNVLDAGTGSNFLTGGSGADTFFLDARGATDPIWSTVVGLGAGDAVTVWGVSQAGTSFAWGNGEGAAGFTGLTMHASAGGAPTVSLTLPGLTDTDLTNGKLAILFGNDSASGSDYMFVFANS
jgi:hypothetical protein